MAIAPPRRVRRAAMRALRCKRGVYTLEFAGVASVLMVLVFGGLEMVWHGLTSVAVENALLQATRAASLGCRQSDGTRAGQAGMNEIMKAARIGGGADAAGIGGLLSGSSLALSALSFNSLAAANADAAQNGTRTGSASGTGAGGQIVEYKLTYDPPLIFIPKQFRPRTTYAHGGTITIKNEPFSNGGTGAQRCS
ncbi:TadE/TadG family type IV pilus assembly protein [Craurococcus roseus]